MLAISAIAVTAIDRDLQVADTLVVAKRPFAAALHLNTEIDAEIPRWILLLEKVVVLREDLDVHSLQVVLAERLGCIAKFLVVGRLATAVAFDFVVGWVGVVEGWCWRASPAFSTPVTTWSTAATAGRGVRL